MLSCCASCGHQQSQSKEIFCSKYTGLLQMHFPGAQEIHLLVQRHPEGQFSKTLCSLAVLLLLQWSEGLCIGSIFPS